MSPHQLTTIAQNAGFEVFSDTTEHLPPAGYKYCGVLIHAAAVFTKFEADGVDATASAAFCALTQPAERYIPGVITCIKLASGTVLAFKVPVQ